MLFTLVEVLFQLILVVVLLGVLGFFIMALTPKPIKAMLNTSFRIVALLFLALNSALSLSYRVLKNMIAQIKKQQAKKLPSNPNPKVIPFPKTKVK